MTTENMNLQRGYYNLKNESIKVAVCKSNVQNYWVNKIHFYILLSHIDVRTSFRKMKIVTCLGTRVTRYSRPMSAYTTLVGGCNINFPQTKTQGKAGLMLTRIFQLIPFSSHPLLSSPTPSHSIPLLFHPIHPIPSYPSYSFLFCSISICRV